MAGLIDAELVGGPWDGKVNEKVTAGTEYIEEPFNGGGKLTVPRWRVSRPLRTTNSGRVAYDYVYPHRQVIG